MKRYLVAMVLLAAGLVGAAAFCALGLAVTAVIPNADDEVERAVATGTRFFREWRG